MRGRVPIARRNLLADRRRLATGVFGVGVSIALIFLLQGLWGGVLKQASAYEDGVGAQLWVGDRGTSNTFESSVVPLTAVDRIRAIPGVDRADPILIRSTVLTLHGRKVLASVIGSRPGAMGGAWSLPVGRAPRSNGEIVVDRGLAAQHGIGLGGRIEVAGEAFAVVGLSAGTRSWMGAYVFMTFDAARNLFHFPDAAAFVLVRTQHPSSVAGAIERQTGLSAVLRETIRRNDRTLLAGVMKGPLDLMVAIAFAAGTMIVALTIYSAVVERAREYGIVKALGTSGTRLLRIVLGQTSALAALGVAAGYVIFRGAAALVVRLRPQFLVSLAGSRILWVVAAAGLMAVLAAILPARRIAQLDPATVYRG
ncbi:MAG: ABC transporter permease [Actinomycetota bacterium]